MRDHVTAGGDELAEFDERDPRGGQGVTGGGCDLSERDAQGGNSRSEVAGEAEFDEDRLDLGQAVDAAVPGGDLRCVADE